MDNIIMTEKQMHKLADIIIAKLEIKQAKHGMQNFTIL